MGYPVPLTAEDWARVRYEYECTTRKVVEICAEHGISAGTLRDRVRRWGWTRRWSGPVPHEGPPPMAVPMIAFAPPEGPPPDPLFSLSSADALVEAGRGGERQDGADASPLTSPDVVEDGRKRPFVVDDSRPIGERLQGAIAQVMPALETTLSSLAAGPMQPRQMEQAARALGSLTRTLRELNGLVAEYGAPGGADDPVEDFDALRADLKRRIDAIVEEERQEQPRRYLAGWEEFAAQAADAMLL